MQKRSATFDTERFVCDWVCRDLLNIAFANTDNHGRNSALLKKPDDIWLSPIYDFAPMKADREGITRTTKWGSPYEEGGEYRWQDIAEQLADLCPAEKTMTTLKETAQMLTGLKTRLEKRGVSEQILKMGFDYLDDKLKRWGLL
ncbi:HipA domain-containing protein [Oceanospirillum sp.]|uniref:HipA domain-containing protein n=1 Tax=Oceanospirillum sp. TaxID=2021254 RepID=UPI003A95656C